MVAIVRKMIGRNPGKKHSVDLEILYQMHFSRVSTDKITKKYDDFKNYLKIIKNKNSLKIRILKNLLNDLVPGLLVPGLAVAE